MSTDPPIFLITDQHGLSQAWIDACADDPALDEPLDLEAAAFFLHGMATALADEAAGATSTEFDGECRRFARASRSAERATRRLAALRVAVQNVLAGTTVAARHQVDRLIDRAIVTVVRDTVRELEREALVDPLTGLLNRRALLRNLEGELGRSARSRVGFCLLFVDLDGLKLVNDGQGYRAGDAVLVRLGEALTAVLRRGDTSYRIGGDEFVAVLPGTTLASVESFVTRLANAGSPSFSWGAAAYPDDGTTVDQLLDAADNRLTQRRRRRR